MVLNTDLSFDGLDRDLKNGNYCTT